MYFQEDELADFTDEDLKFFEQMADHNNVLPYLIKSFCPSIFG